MKIVIWLVIFASACTSSGVIVSKAAPARPAGSPVEVFSTEADVKRPHESLCTVTSWASAGMTMQKGLNIATENAKEKARGCGADAIVITGVSTVRGTELHATAIRYTEGR